MQVPTKALLLFAFASTLTACGGSPDDVASPASPSPTGHTLTMSISQWAGADYVSYDKQTKECEGDVDSTTRLEVADGNGNILGVGDVSSDTGTYKHDQFVGSCIWEATIEG